MELNEMRNSYIFIFSKKDSFKPSTKDKADCRSECGEL